MVKMWIDKKRLYFIDFKKKYRFIYINILYIYNILYIFIIDSLDFIKRLLKLKLENYICSLYCIFIEYI